MDQVQKIETTKNIKKFRETPKFDLFVYYFTEPKEKDTYGNQVQSAIKAYGLNPKDQYKSASVIAHQNLEKLRILASTFGATIGLSLGDMIIVAKNKMLESDNPAWWDRLMKLFGYIEDEKTNPSLQINTQVNLPSFEEWISQNYRKEAVTDGNELTPD